MDKKLLGSQTAKGGFANEHKVAAKLNNWKTDPEAQNWLKIMGYETDKLNEVTAHQIPAKIKKKDATKYGVTETEYQEFVKFKKSDVQIKLIIQIGDIQKIENLSLKKANSNANFNQIDKRTIDAYQDMWHFDNEIALWLKLFSGEKNVKDYANLFDKDKEFKDEKNKRIFIDEMPKNIQDKILNFFDKNKIIVLADTLKGRGGLSADWVLVTQQNPDNTTLWTLKHINEVLNFYGSGDVEISPKGSLKIGKISLQRKGGTPDPTKLQFKFKPCDLFDL